MSAELGALAVQNVGQPNRILSGRAVQLEPSDLEWYQFEVDQPAARGVKPRKAHQRKLAAKLLVPANALVFVDEIAAPVKDRLVAIDFDRLGMMGRMAVNYGKPAMSINRCAKRTSARLI